MRGPQSPTRACGSARQRPPPVPPQFLTSHSGQVSPEFLRDRHLEKGKVRKQSSASPSHTQRWGLADPFLHFSVCYDRCLHMDPPFKTLALCGFLPLSLLLIYYKTSTSITTSSPWAGWHVYGEQGNKRPQVLYRSVSRKLKTHQILLIIKQLANQWRRKDVYLSCCLTKLNIQGNMMIKGH